MTAVTRAETRAIARSVARLVPTAARADDQLAERGRSIHSGVVNRDGTA